MKTEIEVKFCDIDIDAMREILARAGAVCEQPMRDMRRHVFYTVDNSPNAYVRVRAEGDKTTLTYKRFDEISLHGAKEVETIVGDYQAAIDILRQSGLRLKSIQETRRETWHLGEVEVVIDEWPWLEPFIEIEGPSEVAVREAATRLSFDWNDAVFGSATEAYRVSYPRMPRGMVMDDLPEIRFDRPLPEKLKSIDESNGAKE
jgi:adenylate cyclase class 2